MKAIKNTSLQDFTACFFIALAIFAICYVVVGVEEVKIRK